MSTAAEAPAKPYTLAPVAGGKLPEIGPLFSATVSDFTDHLGDYALLGLAQFLVVLPLTFLFIGVMYVGLTVVMIGGAVGATALSAAAGEAGGDDAAGLAALGGFGLTGLVTVVAMFALIFCLVAVLAPIGASMSRAVARHQRGGERMTMGDAFSTLTQDLMPVIAVTALFLTGVLLLLPFCYVPGLAFAFLLTFVPLLTFLHRQGAMAAFRLGAADMMANFSWYGQFGVIYFAIAMVAGNIPVLGQMFLIALQVRAYRERFGDGEEPAALAV